MNELMNERLLAFRVGIDSTHFVNHNPITTAFMHTPLNQTANLSAAPRMTPATTFGFVTHPQCPTSFSTTSHSTPDPSIKACAISGANVPSSIALSQILRPSRALSAQRGGRTGVLMGRSA
jgi:hypothetical protein